MVRPYRGSRKSRQVGLEFPSEYIKVYVFRHQTDFDIQVDESVKIFMDERKEGACHVLAEFRRRPCRRSRNP